MSIQQAHDQVLTTVKAHGFKTENLYPASCRFLRQLPCGLRQELTVRSRGRENPNEFSIELNLLKKKRLLRNKLLVGTIDECCAFVMEHINETNSDNSSHRAEAAGATTTGSAQGG